MKNLKEYFRDLSMGETEERYNAIFSRWVEKSKRFQQNNGDKSHLGDYKTRFIKNPSELTFSAYLYADEEKRPLDLQVKACVKDNGFHVNVVTDDQTIIKKVSDCMINLGSTYTSKTTENSPKADMSVTLTKGADAEELRKIISRALFSSPRFGAHLQEALRLSMEGRTLPKFLETGEDMQTYYFDKFSEIIDPEDPVWKEHTALTKDTTGVWFSGNFNADPKNPLEIQVHTSPDKNGMRVLVATNCDQITKRTAETMLEVGEGYTTGGSKDGSIVPISTIVDSNFSAKELFNTITSALFESPAFNDHIKAVALKRVGLSPEKPLTHEL